MRPDRLAPIASAASWAMVFGDGDGVYFASFTDSIDVMGHELAHGITQFTAGLTYVVPNRSR